MRRREALLGGALEPAHRVFADWPARRGLPNSASPISYSAAGLPFAAAARNAGPPIRAEACRCGCGLRLRAAADVAAGAASAAMLIGGCESNRSFRRRRSAPAWLARDRDATGGSARSGSRSGAGATRGSAADWRAGGCAATGSGARAQPAPRSCAAAAGSGSTSAGVLGGAIGAAQHAGDLDRAVEHQQRAHAHHQGAAAVGEEAADQAGRRLVARGVHSLRGASTGLPSLAAACAARRAAAMKFALPVISGRAFALERSECRFRRRDALGGRARAPGAAGFERRIGRKIGIDRRALGAAARA